MLLRKTDYAGTEIDYDLGTPAQCNHRTVENYRFCRYRSANMDHGRQYDDEEC